MKRKTIPASKASGHIGNVSKPEVMFRIKRSVVFVLIAVMLMAVLTGCAQTTPETIVKTVLVTQQVTATNKPQVPELTVENYNLAAGVPETEMQYVRLFLTMARRDGIPVNQLGGLIIVDAQNPGAGEEISYRLLQVGEVANLQDGDGSYSGKKPVYYLAYKISGDRIVTGYVVGEVIETDEQSGNTILAWREIPSEVWDYLNDPRPDSPVLDENGNFVVPVDFYSNPNLLSSQYYLYGIVPSVSYHFNF